MTVPYVDDVPSTFSTSGWMKAVMCKWNGGIYKLVGGELCVFIFLWYLIWAFSSHFTFSTNYFNDYVIVFRTYQSTVRVILGFMLVYYYQEIYARARRIFFAIPFPDSTFLSINAVVDGGKPGGQLLKRTIFRYILATTFQSYHASSSMFRSVYPQPWDTMKELGLLTDEEIKRIRTKIDDDYPY